MRLEKIQKSLTEKEYNYTYTEQDGVGSIDFIDRGLTYHIWEFCEDDGTCGAETNLMHFGHMEEVTGDYEARILADLEIFDNRPGM
ncbi:MAG: kinase [Eubacteriales bacterium]|nr:kinase [Eubacteriales bacterium]